MDKQEVMSANSIDSLDDYDLSMEYDDDYDYELTSESNESEEQQEESNELNDTESSTEDNDDFDLTTEVLRLKGISDPSRIKFEDENTGAIIEREWNDLTDTERLNILAKDEDPERDLDDDEITLINFLRHNNLTPQQYIQALQQQAADAAIQHYQQSQTPTYRIDQLSDDELFALDLLEKVGEENITDEELRDALEQAKSNEALYAKQVEGLRASYKNLEDQQRYSAQQAQIEHAELQYQDFANNVLNEISRFNRFANQEVELSTDDKNDIANYMLTRRETGVSDFYTDLLNPQVATMAAFWLLRGSEVINELENQIKIAYQRGYAMGKSQPIVGNTKQTSQVVIQSKNANKNNSSVINQSALALGDDAYLR